MLGPLPTRNHHFLERRQFNHRQKGRSFLGCHHLSPHCRGVLRNCGYCWRKSKAPRHRSWSDTVTFSSNYLGNCRYGACRLFGSSGPPSANERRVFSHLDTICGKKNSSIASWISFTSNPNPIDRINLIINAERNFLAQWRRLPAPQGDEERLTSILDKFDQYISSYEKGKDVYLAALQRGEYPDYANDVLIAKQNISDAITEYNAAIRGYGSNRCSVPSIP